jgi:GH43 family beta-xylosidase
VVKRGDGKYVMFLTARDRADGVLRTGVAIADSPVGEFCDVTLHKPMFDCGTATIDATCFVDDDGSAYLYFVKDCSLNVINGVHTSQIFVAKLNKDLTALASEAVLVASPTQKWEAQSLPASCMAELKEKGATSHTAFVWNEGPAVLKKDGKYYLTYSANCYDSEFYAVGCAVADSPMGEFVKYDDNPVMQWVEGELSGPGHNSFFTDINGVLWCAFHCHTDYNRPSGDRRFCYCPVAWDKGKLKLLYL